MFKPTSVIAAVVLIGAFESPGHADEVTARGILTKWLQDAGAQADKPPNSTATPFEYRTMDVKKQCDGTVRDPKALASWWKCFGCGSPRTTAIMGRGVGSGGGGGMA